MVKIFLTVMLALTAASAGATTWPWQDTAPEQPALYCKGFVVGGLASDNVSGMSRTDLWLAWSYVIRSGTWNQTLATSEYQAGREQFQHVSDSATATSILQKAAGECGLDRSGHEITGW